MSNYSLAIQTRPLPTITVGDRITLSPPRTVKLEAQRSTIVPTGVRIGECKQGGYIKVTPIDDLIDKLDFDKNVFEFDYRDEIKLDVINKSYEFLRIDAAKNYLFIFEWISHDVAAATVPTTSVVSAPVVFTPAVPAPIVPIAPVEPAPVEPAPVEPAPVEPAPVEPAPVEPAPVEPALVETTNDETTEEVPVEEPTPTPAPTKRRIIRRRKL
jgi:hypothetical protein